MNPRNKRLSKSFLECTMETSGHGHKLALHALLWEPLSPPGEHVGLFQVTGETQALGLPSQSSELSDMPALLSSDLSMRDSSHIL